jgi:hypothetical protein
MKKLLLVLTLVSLTAFAKNKTYDLTGTVSFKATVSNSEAHTTVNGKTYDSYCDVQDSSVSCTDRPGTFYLTLADGQKVTFSLDLSMYRGTGNPLLDAKGTIQYRVQHILGRGKENDICVPNETSKSPWGHEACYLIFSPSPSSSDSVNINSHQR